MAKAKPVIKVYLLPDEWGDPEYEVLVSNLVGALSEIEDLGVEGDDDVIIIFPKDGMLQGLGEYIHCEVDVPRWQHMSDGLQTRLAQAVNGVLQAHFDQAYIQCKVYPFDDTVGFSLSEPKKA